MKKRPFQAHSKYHKNSTTIQGTQGIQKLAATMNLKGILMHI